MSADLAPPLPRLLASTSAGPLEVVAAASIAASAASDVFSADVREERTWSGGVDLVVCAPLAPAPALRLHVTWAEREDTGALEVSLDVDDLADRDAASRVERDRRTHLAVERFADALGEQLAR